MFFTNPARFGSAAACTCDGADFDGTDDYMLRGAGLTGAADSQSGIFSAWVRLDGGDGSNLTLMSGTGSVVFVTRNSSNIFRIRARNSAGSLILELNTVNTYTSGATWLHVLASWNLLTPGASLLYISDTPDISVVSFVDDTIDHTLADWAVGSLVSVSNKFNGGLAEFYFAPGQYLDFSDSSNRRRFISDAGKPVSLGATGSTPTGTAPLIYFHLDDGEAVANFATNRGTGGSFTISGTLATSSTSPSD